tara:strand:- start:141 stop:401 length:261 start_codon:yes stop_codon:yes gene_type:complete
MALRQILLRQGRAEVSVRLSDEGDNLIAKGVALAPVASACVTRGLQRRSSKPLEKPENLSSLYAQQCRSIFHPKLATLDTHQGIET